MNYLLKELTLMWQNGSDSKGTAFLWIVALGTFYAVFYTMFTLFSIHG